MPTPTTVKRARLLRATLPYVAMFGAAVACAYLPIARIDIRNRGAAEVTELVVRGRCSAHALGSLAPGESTSVWVSTGCGEGAPQLSFRQAGQPRGGGAGYVGTALVPRRVVELGDDGAVSSDLALGGPVVLSPWPVRLP
jgi:hypothetical protein